MRVIIVGGVAGGATAAARIRRLDESVEIIIYERSGYISYANCGLPYYIGGVIQDESDLTLQTPQSFYSRFRINVNVNHEVVKINSLDKTVLVKNLLTNEEFTDKYDNITRDTAHENDIPCFFSEYEGSYFLKNYSSQSSGFMPLV